MTDIKDSFSKLSQKITDEGYPDHVFLIKVDDKTMFGIYNEEDIDTAFSLLQGQLDYLKDKIRAMRANKAAFERVKG